MIDQDKLVIDLQEIIDGNCFNTNSPIRIKGHKQAAEYILDNITKGVYDIKCWDVDDYYKDDEDV